MVESKDDVGTVPRSDRGQTPLEFALCGVDPRWSDSALRDSSRLQPRCRDFAYLDVALCYRKSAGFSAESLREAKYIRADRCLDRSAVPEVAYVPCCGDAAGRLGARDCGAGAAFCGSICMDCAAQDEFAAGADCGLV